MSTRTTGNKGGRPSSDLTPAAKKKKKVDDQRDSRDNKKTVLSDAVHSAHVAFVMGCEPFGYVSFDPNEPISTCSDPTTVAEFVEYLFSGVKHRFCLLKHCCLVRPFFS